MGDKKHIMSQVHQEVLRLLMEAAPKMSAERIDGYIGQTLQNSRRSRRLAFRRFVIGDDSSPIWHPERDVQAGVLVGFNPETLWI